MATTKKTPVKTTKPAAKKAAAPKPRSDYKPGARVKVTRKNSEAKGFVTGIKTTPTGPFIQVNVGTKAVPIMIEARPAKVRGY